MSTDQNAKETRTQKRKSTRRRAKARAIEAEYVCTITDDETFLSRCGIEPLSAQPMDPVDPAKGGE